MGEETAQPDPIFIFHRSQRRLADAVREGRRREFSSFPQFSDQQLLAKLPDPNAAATFEQSRPHSDPEIEAGRLNLYRRLLDLRRREIVPRLKGATSVAARALGPAAVTASWRMGDECLLSIACNLGADEIGLPRSEGTLIFTSSDLATRSMANGRTHALLNRRDIGASMTDSAVRDLARRAGLSATWRDYANAKHEVSIESLRRLLAAMDLPCETAGDIAHSLHRCEATASPPLVTATVGEPFEVPSAGPASRSVRIVCQDGRAVDIPACAKARSLRVRGMDTLGYHTTEIDGRQITIAVAPPRCATVDDIASGQRIWGLVAQVYGLRSHGDFGIGDMAGVIMLAQQAAALHADALALSPLHALFSADPSHNSPYSPSSRLFYNPLHAEPQSLFGATRVARAAADAGVASLASELDRLPLIDWPRSGSAKMAMLRQLFADFLTTEFSAPAENSLAADFISFRDAGGTPLENHARFETLHAASLAARPSAWSWTDWPQAGATPKAQKSAPLPSSIEPK